MFGCFNGCCKGITEIDWKGFCYEKTKFVRGYWGEKSSYGKPFPWCGGGKKCLRKNISIMGMEVGK